MVHSALAPHRQPPEGEQLSASPVPQLVHMFPSAPQAMGEVVIVQVPSAPQQPVGQDAELQTHWPPSHCWPGWHAPLMPQLHDPLVHPSATNAVHETQAAPPVPQLPGAGASQLAPAQQPDAQLVLVHDVHVPVRQFCDEGHVEQSDPPVPQYMSLLPCSQAPPTPTLLQQPVGHDVPLHTH